MSLKKSFFLAMIGLSLLSVVVILLNSIRVLQDQDEQRFSKSTAEILNHVHRLAQKRGDFTSLEGFEVWLNDQGQSLGATIIYVQARSPEATPLQAAGADLQTKALAQCMPDPDGRGLGCTATVLVRDIPGVEPGTLKITKTFPDIPGSRYVLTPLNGLLVAGVIALAGVISWLLGSSYSREIAAISQAADEIGHGNFHKRIQTYPGRDFIPLVQSINRLAKRIQNNIQTIAQQRDHLETILNGMQEGVLVLDDRGKVKIANQAIKQIFGLSQNVQGRNPIEFLHSADLGDAITHCLQSRDQVAHHLFVSMPGARYFDVSIIPLQSGEEQPLSLILVFHDVSELKKLEQVRKDFVANVSHELRTPLTSIKGYAETLLSSPVPDPETTKAFVEVIQKNANTMNQLLEDLLQLARLEAMESKPGLEPVHLSSVLNTAWEICGPQADARQVALVSNLPDQDVVLLSDFEQLVRVLVNILDNAVKYGPIKGRVQVSVQDKGSDWVIAIQDEGPGIPFSLRERIFERFYRIGTEGYGNHVPGTGLGLSICKHIVRNQNGRIWVDSPVPGSLQGSIFFIQLKKAVPS